METHDTREFHPPAYAWQGSQASRAGLAALLGSLGSEHPTPQQLCRLAKLGFRRALVLLSKSHFIGVLPALFVSFCRGLVHRSIVGVRSRCRQAGEWGGVERDQTSSQSGAPEPGSLSRILSMVRGAEPSKWLLILR